MKFTSKLRLVCNEEECQIIGILNKIFYYFLSDTSQDGIHLMVHLDNRRSLISMLYQCLSQCDGEMNIEFRVMKLKFISQHSGYTVTLVTSLL
jgi:hypothetical protein